eukprot:Skav235604  [mRNA]  locus=scaffold3336:75996:77273:+ [translate_table: standard]
MREPKVVTFLKLHEDQQQDLQSVADRRSGITGNDFQRLFETSTSSHISQAPVPCPGLEIGVLCQRTKKVDPGDAKESPRDSKVAYRALLEAIKEQNDFKVQEVLSTCSEVLLLKDGDGNSVLHLAATSISETGASILSYLQHCKSDLEAKNVLGETPLILAVRAALETEPEPGWLSLVSCLLEGRADPNAADELNEETPLMEAACYGSRDMCRLLLDFKADALMKTANGGTAIDFASGGQVAKLLGQAQAAQAAQADQAARPPSSKPAPFATAVGFNTWSGGLAERWSQAPKAQESDPAEAKRKESFSESNDFKVPTPGLVFGSQVPLFSANAHFTSDGGYRGRTNPKTSFPFAEKSWQSGTKAVSQDQHFRTLGLSPQACSGEIRAAYRKLARQYHPDKNQGSKEAAEKFRQVRRAYEQLSAGF